MEGMQFPDLLHFGGCWQLQTSAATTVTPHQQIKLRPELTEVNSGWSLPTESAHHRQAGRIKASLRLTSDVYFKILSGSGDTDVHLLPPQDLRMECSLELQDSLLNSVSPSPHFSKLVPSLDRLLGAACKWTFR